MAPPGAAPSTTSIGVANIIYSIPRRGITMRFNITLALFGRASGATRAASPSRLARGRARSLAPRRPRLPQLPPELCKFHRDADPGLQAEYRASLGGPVGGAAGGVGTRARDYVMIPYDASYPRIE
jgi:hypothetical protein